MKKLLTLSLIILVNISSFTQNTNPIDQSQLEKTKEIVKDGTKKISETKSVYNDLKNGTSLVYDDLKSLGIEGKQAMKDIVSTVKQASIKTWDLLVKQQLVWSFCFLTITISSILIFFRTIKSLKKTQTEITKTGDLKESNIILTGAFAIITIILFVMSVNNFEKMLTGFINPEFGALRTLIELGQKIK